MTRREFLGALSALLAATAVEPMSLTSVPMRPTPWTGFIVDQWYSIECQIADGIMRVFINGEDVSYDARAVKDIGRFMAVDTKAQGIRFGASGLAKQSGFIWRPEKQLPDSFSLGFNLKVKDNSGMDLDDLYVVNAPLPLAQIDNPFVTDAPRNPDWFTDALGYARTTRDEIQLERGYETIRIEALRQE